MTADPASTPDGESRLLSGDRLAEPATERPLLASEVLRDDLAPREPLAVASRVVGCVLGVGCLVVASLPALHVAPGPVVSTSTLLGWVGGMVALLVALVPMPYAVRAVSLLAVALGAAGAGTMAVGPAFALRQAAGPWAAAQLPVLWALPAALLFRARYRAYAPTRWLLVGCLVLALPHLAGDALRLIEAFELGVRVANGVAMGAVLLSLLGFMGAESTGAGDTIAWTIPAAVTAALASELIWSPDRLLRVGLPVASLASVVVVGLAGMAAALGGFGLLAAGLGPSARAQTTQTRSAPRGRPTQSSIGGWLWRR
jgi:hypothetical protein